MREGVCSPVVGVEATVDSREAECLHPLRDGGADARGRDDETAIEKSLAESERLVSEGNARQAVHEILWLLETFSTVFRSEKILEGEPQRFVEHRLFARRAPNSVPALKHSQFQHLLINGLRWVRLAG